jgi:hypothetical protein
MVITPAGTNDAPPSRLCSMGIDAAAFPRADRARASPITPSLAEHTIGVLAAL